MKNKKPITYFFSGIIVISLVVVTIQSNYLNKKQDKTTEANSYLGSFSNPEVAYTECKAILLEVSKAINTGTKEQ